MSEFVTINVKNNIDELKEILDKAVKEANTLGETIEKLNKFEVKVETEAIWGKDQRSLVIE